MTRDQLKGMLIIILMFAPIFIGLACSESSNKSHPVKETKEVMVYKYEILLNDGETIEAEYGKFSYGNDGMVVISEGGMLGIPRILIPYASIKKITRK